MQVTLRLVQTLAWMALRWVVGGLGGLGAALAPSRLFTCLISLTSHTALAPFVCSKDSR